MPGYRWLAQFYDDIGFGMTPFTAARQAILGPIYPRIHSACDLACGTGATAVGFAHRGLPAFAVDLSPTMCRKTRELAREEKVKVSVVCADMRDFVLPQQVDLISCEYDALNHVPEKSDLARVAAAVKRSLNPGGYFYFDVNMRPAFATNWSKTSVIERPGFFVTMECTSAPSLDRARAEVTIFVQSEKNRWKRYRERVDQVCWSDREIRATLKASGFRTVRAWDANPFLPDDFYYLPGYRMFYLARA